MSDLSGLDEAPPLDQASGAGTAGPKRVPLGWLWGAGAALALAVVLLFVGSTLMHVVGYLLAPLVVLSLVSVFRFKDQRLSMDPLYSPRVGTPIAEAQVVLLIAGVVVGAFHTWPLAWDFARWINQ